MAEQRSTEFDNVDLSQFNHFAVGDRVRSLEGVSVEDGGTRGRLGTVKHVHGILALTNLDGDAEDVLRAFMIMQVEKV